jgi:hypothetical protein
LLSDESSYGAPCKGRTTGKPQVDRLLFAKLSGRVVSTAIVPSSTYTDIDETETATTISAA